MGKPYDIATKHLVEDRLADWLPLCGRPILGPARVIDSDVSTVTSVADKVLRVDSAEPWLMHLELQTGPDADLPKDIQVRNTLLGKRHGLPVVSVVVLLRRAALLGNLTGRHTEGFQDEELYLDFRYRMIKIWEEPLERFLTGGLATLPLAVLTDEAAPKLPEVFDRIGHRLRAETTPSELDILWITTYVLSGARYPGEYIRELMKMTQGLKDLPTYQLILDEGRKEGRKEGRIEGDQNSIVIVGTESFGEPDKATLAAIRAITDTPRLERMLRQIRKVDSWQALLAVA